MKSKYKVVIIISLLLTMLSITTSIVNYIVSLNNAQEQLKNQSLPLSLDNIYTDIQKNIIEPFLVSSMMANDTFVHDWLLHEEENRDKIIKYLERIKNKYEMFNTFLVSDITKSYYTQNGFIEKIDEKKVSNKWYFDFKNQESKHEINLDFNEKLSNNLIMFINYKIFDNNFHFLGATGVALKISYIDDLLKTFRTKHKFIVTFFNEKGEVVLAERNLNFNLTIDDNSSLKEFKDLILSKKQNVIEYEKFDEKHILNTKYIPELDLYLVVDANLSDFTRNVKEMFHLNLFISLLITVIVAFIVSFVIKKYSSKLEYLSNHDALTNISNRRDFEANLNRVINIKNDDEKIALIFLDIDNFKQINDSLGHQKGDDVLKRVALILKDNIRQKDFVARWGGEEFIIALIDTKLDDAKNITEKLRTLIEDDILLKEISNTTITASFGITMISEFDSINKAVSRADEAMYISKTKGKNQTNII